MAPRDIYDSKHWRDRAPKMRAIAEGMDHTRSAQLLNDLANDYDKLADRAEVRRARDMPSRSLTDLHREAPGPDRQGG